MNAPRKTLLVGHKQIGEQRGGLFPRCFVVVYLSNDKKRKDISVSETERKYQFMPSSQFMLFRSENDKHSSWCIVSIGDESLEESVKKQGGSDDSVVSHIFMAYTTSDATAYSPDKITMDPVFVGKDGPGPIPQRGDLFYTKQFGVRVVRFSLFSSCGVFNPVTNENTITRYSLDIYFESAFRSWAIKILRKITGR